MKISFCFGNGESRYGIDVDHLNDYGPVYGCNAIYRDWHVDNLISCDKYILKEIIGAQEHRQSNVYTRPEWRKTFQKYPEIKYLPNLPFDDQDTGSWSSGPCALLLACDHQADIVVMFGYDLWDKNGELNNIYKDSPGYPQSTSRPRDPVPWQRQIAKIFQAYKHVQFVQVQDDGWIVPEEWADCENFSLDSRQNLFYVLENMDRV